MSFNLMLIHIFLYPCHNYIYEIILLHFTQFSSRLHLMPFPNTLPSTCSSCVLCYKYRMSLHRCLFTIVRNYCRCFSLGNKILCMLPNSIHSLFFYVIYIFLLQMKTATELELASLSNSCLYHSSFVIRISLLPAHE